MSFIKCKICNVELSEEKCVFATVKRTIDGKEYLFCSERHADEYEKKQEIISK